MTEDDMIAKIGKSNDENDMIEILKQPNITEKVLKLIAFNSKTFYQSNHTYILKEIVKITKDPTTLEVVIDSTNIYDYAVIDRAITNSAANEVVYCAAIRKSVILTSIEKEIILGYIAITTTSTDTLKEILKNIKNEDDIETIKTIIENPNSTEEIYQNIIETIKEFESNKKDQIIKEIVKKTKSPETLIKIITINIEPDIIKLIIDSNYINEEVIKAIQEHPQFLISDELKSLVKEAEKKLNNKNKSIIKPKEDENQEEIEEEEDYTEQLRLNVSECASTMLWGLSGVGKTSRVKRIDPHYTEIRLKNGMLPEEVLGGRTPDALMVPPAWYITLVKKCEEDPEHVHILFIDEFTNVSRTVQSYVMDIIEQRIVNGNEEWPLPKNCAIIAAGNRPSESTAVVVDQLGGVMPAPTHRRFDYQIEIIFNMEEWEKWALEINPGTGHTNIHPVVLAYCHMFGDTVMYTEINIDDLTEPALDPRRWEKVSRMLYASESRGKKTSTTRIKNSLGETIGTSFAEFYHKKSFNIQKVANNEYNENSFQTPEEKLFALSYLITDHTLSDIIKEDFIKTYLGEEYYAIYLVTKKKEENKSEGQLPSYSCLTNTK